jgi:hypothetical protein
MRATIWIAVASSILLTLGVISSIGGDEPKPALAPDEPFAGKVLMVYGREPAKGALLEKVKVKQLGNKSFLVGKTVDRTGNGESRWAGLTMWTAIDEVTDIYEFTSVDAAREAFAEIERKRNEVK